MLCVSPAGCRASRTREMCNGFNTGVSQLANGDAMELIHAADKYVVRIHMRAGQAETQIAEDELRVLEVALGAICASLGEACTEQDAADPPAQRDEECGSR